MGVGAVTITVDARPMNELVGADRGVLVPYRGTGTQHLATTHQFDEAGLEAAIERTIAMSDEECAQIGAGHVRGSSRTRAASPAASKLRSRAGSGVMKLNTRGRPAHARVLGAGILMLATALCFPHSSQRAASVPTCR